MNEGDERYSMVIARSNEDDAFIVTAPELLGCKTHDITRNEAARRS